MHVCDRSFRIQLGISSGHIDFLVYMLFSCFSSVSSNIIKLLGRRSTQGCWISDSGSRSLDTETKSMLISSDSSHHCMCLLQGFVDHESFKRLPEVPSLFIIRPVAVAQW
jgi:hypothetical protein